MAARRHRINNYWDVIYDPLIDLDDFIDIKFGDLKHNLSPCKGLFDLGKLKITSKLLKTSPL